jgi:hypothetical protein
MVRWLQLGDCNVVGSKPAGKRARCKDQLQRQKKGGDLVRSFLPATRRPGLNREARKVGLTSLATGRCAGVGEEGGAGSLAMKKRTAARAEEAEQLRTSSMFLTRVVPDLRRRRSSATPVGAGSRCLRASSLPPTPLPSLSYFLTPPIFGGGDGFGLGNSSPGGGGGTGKTGW